MRVSRLLGVSLACLLVLTFSARSTFASPAGVDVIFTPSAATAAYDIEAYDYYCTAGGIGCVPSGTNLPSPAIPNCVTFGSACPGLSYADAEAFGLPNGTTYGTPAAMYLECQQFTSNGYRQAIVSVYSAAGAATYDSIENDQGVISGKGTLLDWAYQNPNFDSNLDPEESIDQGSSISASAFDPDGGYNNQGTRGSVTGIQNTDNSADTLNAGGFRITISGEIDTYDDYGTWQSATTGTISCYAGGPHAYDLADTTANAPWGTYEPAPAYNEGELEWDYSQAPDIELTFTCVNNLSNHSEDCLFGIKNVGNVTVSSPFSVSGDIEVSGSNPSVTVTSTAGGAGCASSDTFTNTTLSSGVAAAFAFVGCSPPATLVPGTTDGLLTVEVGGDASSTLTYSVTGTAGRVPGEINLTNNSLAFSGTE